MLFGAMRFGARAFSDLNGNSGPQRDRSGVLWGAIAWSRLHQDAPAFTTALH